MMARGPGTVSRSVCAAGAALVLSLLVSPLGAGTARARVVQLPNGHRIGIAPRAGVAPHHGIAPASIPRARASPAPASGDNGNMDYSQQQGPVLHSSAPYLIFWDPQSAIPATTEKLLGQYFADVAHDSGAASNDYGVARQYSDQAGIADYAQTFTPSTQVIYDTGPLPPQDTTNCPNTSATYYPRCITDAQLQAELTRVLSARGLPSDGPAGSSQLVSGAPIYFIVTPPNVNVCLSGNPNPYCGDTHPGFCAYHNYFTDNGSYVLYATIPLLGAESADPSLSPKGCQSDGNTQVQRPNNDGGDVAIKYMAHEDLETITDPLLNAWYDRASGNETGDNCNFYQAAPDPVNGASPRAFAPTIGGDATAGTLYDQLVNANPYYVQSIWSNGDTYCELRPVTATLTPNFTEPAGARLTGSQVSFDPNTSSSSAGYSSVAWSFGDGASSFASTATTSNPSPATVSHTYTAPGTYTVVLTVVDTEGNLATTARGVTIRARPAATFSLSPAAPLRGQSVAFDASATSDPNPGGSITSYSWSFGDSGVGTGGTQSHPYAAPGPYTVTLTVTDNFGLVSTISKRLQVVVPLRAAFAFSPSAPVAGKAVSFAGGGSSDPNSGGSITSYSWSFGDGGTGTGRGTTHSYAAPGRYTAKLTVTDTYGVSASVSEFVLVTAPGKTTLTRGSLSGIRNGKPTLAFELIAGVNVSGLAKIVIGLPRGLGFDKSLLARGLRVKGATGFAGRLTRGKLTVTLNGAPRAVHITIGRGAITVSKSLARASARRRRATVKILVTAIDSGGTQTVLPLKLPI